MTASDIIAELNRRLDALLPPAREAYSAAGDVAEHAYSCAAWGEGQWCCLDRRDDDYWDFRAWLARQLTELLDVQRPVSR